MCFNLRAIRLHVSAIVLLSAIVVACGCSSNPWMSRSVDKEHFVGPVREEPQFVAATEIENFHHGDICQVKGSGFRKSSPDENGGNDIPAKLALIGRVKEITPDYLVLENAHEYGYSEFGVPLTSPWNKLPYFNRMFTSVGVGIGPELPGEYCFQRCTISNIAQREDCPELFGNPSGGEVPR